MTAEDGGTTMKRKTGDRRGRPRFEIIGDLWGSLDVAASLTLVNLGLGGALLASPLRFPPESVHSMVAITDEETHTLTARVRHCTATTAAGGGYLVGVEFLDVSPMLHDFLARQLAFGNGTLPVEA